MDINLIPDSSVSSAPDGFTAAIQAAANIFDQDFLGNYTVNITYGWGTYDNQTNSELTTANNGISSIGGTENSTIVSYATVKSWLTANATLSDQQTAVASLPANTSSFPGDADSFFVSSAQEKALGVYSGSSGTVDGSIGFNDTDPANSNFEGLALCEIAHALGWITDFYAGAPTIADLFRFGSQGSYQWTGGDAAYFSLNDGGTDLANFATTFDYTLFTNLTNDPLCVPITPQTMNLTSFDIEVLNAVGFGQAPVSASVSGSNFSVNEGQSVAISSELTVSNPDGDSITEYQFLNSGTDGGHFVVGSTVEAAGQWSEVSAANLSSVSYVGGSSPGTDTLEAEVFDATAGSWSSPSAFTATTIGQTDMIMSNPSNGDYEIYDVGGNAILAAYSLGQVGSPWTFAGLGTFQAGDTSDMLLRNTSTGAFEAYYISGNVITNAAPIGVVGTNWKFSGIADFDGASSLSELLLRNSSSGSFELYHVVGGGVLSGASVAAVGNNFSAEGFGNFSGSATTQMMMQDNSGDASAGQLELYTYQPGTASFSGIGVGKVGSNLTIVGAADLLGNGTTQTVMRQSNGDFWLYSYSAATSSLSGQEVGTIGSNFSVVGFGPLGASSQDEMLMQNAAGAFEVYQYVASENAFVGTSMGAVGAPWVVDGIAAEPPAGGAASVSSTAQLVQAMASVGGNSPVTTATTPLASAETTQSTLLTTPQAVLPA